MPNAQKQGSTHASAQDARLLVIANRLPITIKQLSDGNYSYTMSSGGLVTGLGGLTKSTNFLWYGWPGVHIPEAEVESVERSLRQQYSAIPLWIEDEVADKHYNGMSSR